MHYKSIIWNNLKRLSNLTFAIILLLIIASLSIIGTIIEQDNTLEYYQAKYPIHNDQVLDFNWQIIQIFHLDQLYTNYIFLTLIVMFGLSLIICTFSTQLPSLKNAKRWKFKTIIKPSKQLHAQSYNQFHSSGCIIYHLNKINYYIFYQSRYMYAYKGLHGRLAPVFVHFALILLLIGSSVSLFTSFCIQEMIPVGETFNLQNIVKAGFLSKIPTNVTGRVVTFDIDYYEDKSIKQFYSSVILHNHNKNTTHAKRISVNHPLYFEGLTIYQTDWQINGLNIEIDTIDHIQVPVKKFKEGNATYWIATLNYDTSQQFSLLLSSIHEPIMCYDQNGQLIDSLNVQEYKTIQNIPIKITNILTSTGLQIKQDPGVRLIYISFGILMISSLNSYISYTQIWIVLNNNQIHVSGATNRAEIKFEEDIFELKKLLIR